MTNPFHQRARVARPDGIAVDITPTEANWQFSSLKTLHLAAGQSFAFDTADSEWIVLPLSGSCRVECGKEAFEIEGRESVFARVSDFAYVPRDASVTITSTAGGRFAL